VRLSVCQVGVRQPHPGRWLGGGHGQLTRPVEAITGDQHVSRTPGRRRVTRSGSHPEPIRTCGRDWKREAARCGYEGRPWSRGVFLEPSWPQGELHGDRAEIVGVWASLVVLADRELVRHLLLMPVTAAPIQLLQAGRFVRAGGGAELGDDDDGAALTAETLRWVRDWVRNFQPFVPLSLQIRPQYAAFSQVTKGAAVCSRFRFQSVRVRLPSAPQH
jgi:hypothetical protein